MTNEHVITKEMIEKNKVIDVIYCYEKEWIKIKLDMTQRFIKYDLEMDITIIEIIPTDKIGKIYFLLPNINEINYHNIINQSDTFQTDIFISKYVRMPKYHFS